MELIKYSQIQTQKRGSIFFLIRDSGAKRTLVQRFTILRYFLTDNRICSSTNLQRTFFDNMECACLSSN